MKRRKRRSTVPPGTDREHSRCGLVHGSTRRATLAGGRHGRHLLGPPPRTGRGAIEALSWLRRVSPSRGGLPASPRRSPVALRPRDSSVSTARYARPPDLVSASSSPKSTHWPSLPSRELILIARGARDERNPVVHDRRGHDSGQDCRCRAVAVCLEARDATHDSLDARRTPSVSRAGGPCGLECVE